MDFVYESTNSAFDNITYKAVEEVTKFLLTTVSHEKRVRLPNFVLTFTPVNIISSTQVMFVGFLIYILLFFLF